MIKTKYQGPKPNILYLQGLTLKKNYRD